MEFESVFVEEKDGEDVGDGGAGGGVSTFGDMDSIDGIDSEVLGYILVEGEILCSFNFLFGARLLIFASRPASFLFRHLFVDLLRYSINTL